MCGKLHAVAASNNRDHQRDHPIFACSRHICMGVVLRAHSVLGESRIQRNASGEVATTSPLFYSEPHRSHVLFVRAFTQHDLHILVTAPFRCNRNAQAACAQSFTLWPEAAIEITREITHIYTGVVLRAHSVREEPRIQRNAAAERLQQ